MTQLWGQRITHSFFLEAKYIGGLQSSQASYFHSLLALGQMLVPICSWANASGHLLVGQLLATINACLPQCLWCKCLCQTACAQTACVNLLAASQKVNLLVVKLLAGQLLVFSWRLRCEFKE